MIQFEHKSKNIISLEEKKNAEKVFVERLGDFREEFEEKEGFVKVDHDADINSMNGYTFVFQKGSSYELSDFIKRFEIARTSSK